MPLINKKMLAYAGIILIAVTARGIPLLTAHLWRDEDIVGIMSLRVLAGEFPLFFYGQNFMGSLEAYLSAVLVLCLGPRAWVLELLPVLLSLLFLFLIGQLGRRIFTEPVVRWALLYLALPPYFLLDWTHEARSHYPLTLIFGTLLTLLAYRLVYRDLRRGERSWHLAGLGLLAGLGWWTNHLIIAYLLPVFFFLWLRDKKLPLRGSFLLLVAALLLGHLPRSLFQLRQSSPGLKITQLILWPDWQTVVSDFFGNALPIVGGIPFPLALEPAKIFAYLFFLVLFGLSLAYILIRRRAGLADLVRLRLGRTDGSELLLLILFVTTAVNVLTVFNVRLSDNDQKYVLPFYTVLPFILALFLREIESRSRSLGLVLLVLLLGCNFWGALSNSSWPLLVREKRLAVQQENDTMAALIQALREKGVSRVYADDSISGRLTFLSGEKIVAADPYQASYLRHAQWVDSADHPAYLISKSLPFWEQNLKALGGAYRKTALTPGFDLYTDFTPPPGPSVPLSRQGWTATAGSEAPTAPEAVDGDVESRWSVAQKAGTYFLLDLGRLETIHKVVWWPGDYHHIPAGYQIEVSETGKDWQTVTRVDAYHGPFFWSGPGPMVKIRRGRVEASFQPVSARLIRISLTRDAPGENWSINELLVYRPLPQGNPLAAGPETLQELIAFLNKQRISLAYADHWLSAVVAVKSGRTINTMASNHFLGDNGENYLAPEHFPSWQLHPHMALIIDQAEADPLEELLEGSGFSCRQRTFGPYRVYYQCSQAPQLLLDRSGWRASANANPREASRALDGDPRTRWTSLRPQTPDLSFQLDLGRVETVQGLVLNLGNSSRDYPRALRILVSLDGRRWQETTANWFSDLYWAGNRLFKKRGEKITYRFNPANCRYLRIDQRGSHPTYYWSIHEIALIGPAVFRAP